MSDTSEIRYRGGAIFVRLASPVRTRAIYVAVSRTNPQTGVSVWHMEGTNKPYTWHRLTTRFQERVFRRSGWETVVITDENQVRKRGWFLDPHNQTIYITFNGWDNAISIQTAPKVIDFV
ncbi:hypothetical protein PENSPDRAFT_651144 [Peniophora sp. CONT]|nr:hypothetical protein PENSPDRAFT_651144 [Peniophora sp. CONT]